MILDTSGAEKLLGRGDMLYMASDSSKLARIQGCFVSDAEIERVVDFWRERQAGDEVAAPQVAPWAGMTVGSGAEGDALLGQALALLETKTHVSTSLLQRQLHIGFPRAARLMEQLEEMGAVSVEEGSRSRTVLRSEQAGPAAD